MSRASERNSGRGLRFGRDRERSGGQKAPKESRSIGGRYVVVSWLELTRNQARLHATSIDRRSIQLPDH